MINIRESLIENINELIPKIKMVKEFLDKAPQGHIRISRKQKRFVEYYYETKKNTPEHINKYLKKSDAKDVELIHALIKKSYYQKLLPVLQNEYICSKNMLKIYEPDKKYEIFSSLDSVRQNMLENLFPAIEDKVKEWEDAEWKKDDLYENQLLYETFRGEKVRSKSEVIIANMLYNIRDICAYKYEFPLYLKKRGISIHPDFTIVVRKTGERYYWEHFGMMDDEEYMKKCIYKINCYAEEGIVTGKNLIVTFESSTQPLNTDVLKMIIQECFCK